MSPRQEIFAVLIASAFMLLIVELVRRRSLKIEYSWIWLFTAASLLLLVIRYDILERITAFIGAVLPTTTLFIFALLYLTLFVIYLSVKTTTYDNHIKKLNQEIALLKNKLEESLQKRNTENDKREGADE